VIGEVFDFAGRLGAGLIKAILGALWLFGSLYLGARVVDHGGKKWQGWLVGIIALILIGALFFPAMSAMDHIRCRGADDYQDCIDQEGQYAPEY
jgi:hypothetical protein